MVLRGGESPLTLLGTLNIRKCCQVYQIQMKRAGEGCKHEALSSNPSVTKNKIKPKEDSEEPLKEPMFHFKSF
jgi:hypothetical protein